MSNRSSQVKDFLRRVLATGGLESAGANLDTMESIAERNQLRKPERDVVASTLHKLATGEELTPGELFAAEAIIIPDKRPAIDVVDGDFEVAHPDWLHFGGAAIKATIRSLLPSIGRVEVSGIPGLPYAGTGFVVGHGILMTNRHVAELFTSGLGQKGLAFKPGMTSEVDFKRERGRSDKQILRVRRVLMIHPYWDMALLQVDGLTERNPALKLSLDQPDQLLGRDVAVIGYPGFDPRNPTDIQNQVFGGVYYVKRLQPGKLGGRRGIRSYGRTISAMTHDASTLPGNSGSAVVDVSRGTVVALHFAGIYLDTNFTVPSWELSRDRRIVDSGVQFHGEPNPDASATTQWWSSAEAAALSSGAPQDLPPAAQISNGSHSAAALALGAGASWTIPLQVTVRLGGEPSVAATAASPATGGEPTEKLVMPTHDLDYTTRLGYDEHFLGIAVPLPTVTDESLCAPLRDGEGHLLPYHHFSLVMHRNRRLPIFTAANFDGHPQKKKPEPGKSYSRKALGGLGKNDSELWFTDPRLADEHQLPDRFFTKDNGAFDRGHVVRREDVAWGDSFQEVQFANGDTFHTTNCTPQVAGFNQSASNQNWGDLERLVSSQAGTDRLSILAGPVLADDDPTFVGVDGAGQVRVRIPEQYWKVILAEEDGQLRAFAFVLRQDLADVPLEFAVTPVWRQHMISIADLEEVLGLVRFHSAVHAADQAFTDHGEAVRTMADISITKAPVTIERPTPNSGDDVGAHSGLEERAAPGGAVGAAPQWRVAGALLALRRQVDARAPRRSKASDGTIGDAAHATRDSDHNPWVTDGAVGVVTAMDLTHDPANGCDAGALAESIRTSQDRRLKYMIWNRRIVSSYPTGGTAAWVWRPYGGSNPHAKHVHVSVLPEKDAYDSESPWAV